MKAVFTSVAVIGASLMLSSAAFAGKPFEGTIQFKKTVGPVTANYVYYVKGSKIRVEEMGDNGDVQGIMLIDTKSNSVIALSPERKMYIEVPNKRPATEPQVTVQETGNQKTINGFECQEVKVVSKAEGREVSYWVAKNNFDFFVPMLETLNRKDKLAVYFMKVPDVDGVFPIVGTEKKLDGDITLTRLEVTKMQPKNLDDKLFSIPAGYTKVERD